jgi:hypothetical protein
MGFKLSFFSFIPGKLLCYSTFIQLVYVQNLRQSDFNSILRDQQNTTNSKRGTLNFHVDLSPGPVGGLFNSWNSPKRLNFLHVQQYN